MLRVNPVGVLPAGVLVNCLLACSVTAVLLDFAAIGLGTVDPADGGSLEADSTVEPADGGSLEADSTADPAGGGLEADSTAAGGGLEADSTAEPAGGGGLEADSTADPRAV